MRNSNENSNTYAARNLESSSGYVPNVPISPEGGSIPHATDLNSSAYGGYSHPGAQRGRSYLEYRTPTGLGSGSGIIPFPMFSSNAVASMPNNASLNARNEAPSTSGVNSSYSKSSTPSSSRTQQNTDAAAAAANRSRKQREKAEKEERDRQKQAEKKKRRLEKALATAAAIRTQLEKKKQKRKEEEQRLDQESAALAESVALHVLVDEDAVFRGRKNQSEGSNRLDNGNPDSDQDEEEDFSNGSGDSEEEDNNGRLSRDRTGETTSSAECNSISVTSKRDFDELQKGMSRKEGITSNAASQVNNRLTLVSEESKVRSIRSNPCSPSPSPSPSHGSHPNPDPNSSHFDVAQRGKRQGLLDMSSILLETIEFKDEKLSSKSESFRYSIHERSSFKHKSSKNLFFVNDDSMDEKKKDKMVVREAELRAISSTDKAKQAEMAASFAAVQAMAAIKIAEEARVEAEAARKAANDAMKSAMNKKMASDEDEYENPEDERNALKIKLENTEKLLNEKNNYISELERVLEDLKAKIEASRLQCPTNSESNPDFSNNH